MARVAPCQPARLSATSRPRSLRASPRRRSPASSTASSSTCRFRSSKDAAIRIVTDRSPEALPLVRHSTAHLLAAAVTSLFPGAQCGIGPATDEGFFYDFVVERPFVPEDLERIETEDEGARRRGSALRAADVAARRRRRTFFGEARRAAQGAADRREDRRSDRTSPATRSRIRRPSSISASVRTSRRPAS